MSDREFFEYNIDNIFKNLLQAEYHAKNIIEGKLLPEHLSCINKHLAFVEGEAEEATAHCLVADPESCSFFRQFMLDIRNLRHKILKEGAGPELQSKIRDLRKKLEVRFHQYDTSKCEVCKVNIKPIKSQEEKEESTMYEYYTYHALSRLDFPEEERSKIVDSRSELLGGVYVTVWRTKEPLKEETLESLELYEWPPASKKEQTSQQEQKVFEKVPSELVRNIAELIKMNPAAISELLTIIQTECYAIASHLRINWQDIQQSRWWTRIARRIGTIALEMEEELGDPVPPEKVKELEQKGFEIHGHPICILAKTAKGMSRQEAERECLAEGKVHPISFWAAAYKEKLIS